MADNTKIEWTDATVNFWWSCTKVGPGCDGCYAEAWAARFGEALWGSGVPRRKVDSALLTLAKLHKGAQRFQVKHGRRQRVFLQSMSDLFDKEVPDEWFVEAWVGIVMANALDFQIVTKRVSFVEKRLAGRTWPQHAGLIISVVNQEEADRDIPRLLDLKARLGFPWVGLSMEPLLGGVILRPEWLALLDWVIAGGERGPGARPMHPDWARSLRDQCAVAGVAFYFKQWGEYLSSATGFAPAPDRIIHNWPGGGCALRVGKKAAGRLLDGIGHNGSPLGSETAA